MADPERLNFPPILKNYHPKTFRSFCRFQRAIWLVAGRKIKHPVYVWLRNVHLLENIFQSCLEYSVRMKTEWKLFYYIFHFRIQTQAFKAPWSLGIRKLNLPANSLSSFRHTYVNKYALKKINVSFKQTLSLPFFAYSFGEFAVWY